MRRKLFLVFVLISVIFILFNFLNYYFNFFPNFLPYANLSEIIFNEKKDSKTFKSVDKEVDPTKWILMNQEIGNLKNDLLLREKLLDAREKALDEIEKIHKSNFIKLQEKQDELFFLQKKLKQKEQEAYDRKKNVENIANKIMNIEPDKAVKILNTLDEQLLIEIFEYIDLLSEKQEKISISAYLISLMDTQKIEKMIRLKTSSFWDHRFLDKDNQNQEAMSFEKSQDKQLD